MNDYAFSEKEYVRQKGLCNGSTDYPCSTPLTEGKSSLRLGYITSFFVFIITFIVAANYLLHHLIPQIYEGIYFDHQFSEVNESQRTLAVSLSREMSEEEVILEVLIKPITATNHSDYEAESGQLIFAKGQLTAEIVIPILMDNDYREGQEMFSIQLANVRGQPTHQVMILDAPLPEDQVTKAEALIKEQSRLAADLAGYIKKELVIRKTITKLPAGTETREIFIKELSNNMGNMSRARDAYVAGFLNLKNLDQLTVGSTLDNWLASLERRNLEQQLRATIIMKDQYQRYMQHNLVEMDIWLKELLNAVPPNKQDTPNNFLKI
ncbi:MAG: hypothetical protein MI867_20160 [Pseudomonadales bacterium]|nr:hypothetical protein [Pseudomonadales bacterium]